MPHCAPRRAPGETARRRAGRPRSRRTCRRDRGAGSAPSAVGATTWTWAPEPRSSGWPDGAVPRSAGGYSAGVPAGLSSCSLAWVCSIANVSGFMPAGTVSPLAQSSIDTMPGGAQSLTLHRTHAGHEQQVTGCDDLAVAGRAASARHDVEFAARVARGDGRAVRRESEAPISDERGEALGDGGRRLACRSSTSCRLSTPPSPSSSSTRSERVDPEPVELVDVGRQLHQRRPTRAWRAELCVLHHPAPPSLSLRGSRRSPRTPSSRTPPGRPRRRRGSAPRSCALPRRRGIRYLVSWIATTPLPNRSRPRALGARAPCPAGRRVQGEILGSPTAGTRPSRASIAAATRTRTGLPP